MCRSPFISVLGRLKYRELQQSNSARTTAVAMVLAVCECEVKVSSVFAQSIVFLCQLFYLCMRKNTPMDVCFIKKFSGSESKSGATLP